MDQLSFVKVEIGDSILFSCIRVPGPLTALPCLDDLAYEEVVHVSVGGNLAHAVAMLPPSIPHDLMALIPVI